jgi:proliferating cell nuclear antigen PCNA
MKITIAETKSFQDAVSVLSELVNEGKFSIKKDQIEFIAMDPANVAMVIFRMFSSACAEYSVKEELDIGVNLTNFKMILRRAKATDMITLEFEEKNNKLKITMKGGNTRTFQMPVLELEERKINLPNLEFDSKIIISSDIIIEAIDDAEIVGDSVSFSCEDKKLLISARGDLSQANIDIEDLGLDGGVKIDCKQKSVSKYSIEYLKKMLKGSKLSKITTLQFKMDYPLKLDFLDKDKMSVTFILAPRVDQD